MARNQKAARHINVDDVDYRWRATGNDGWISLTVWPANEIGPPITAFLPYDEGASRKQLVVTNRLVRRVIELACSHDAYDPSRPGTQLNLRDVEDRVDWSDAVRAAPSS